MNANLFPKRKKDAGQPGNGGQWAAADRQEPDVEIPPYSDDALEWDHGDTIDWDYPAAESDIERYEDGSVKVRTLLDGTEEHYDADGTFAHVLQTDGSMVLIDGDDDHPYIAHRRMVEYAFETHELTDEQARARFGELSPQLASHSPENARALADGIARAMDEDDLYRAEELCESAAQQHELTAWLQRTAARPATGAVLSTSDPSEVSAERDRLDRHFAIERGQGDLPHRFGYVPMTFIDERGAAQVAVDVTGVPDALARDTSTDPAGRVETPAVAELRERVRVSAARGGIEVSDVRVESELRAARRLLHTYKPFAGVPGV